MNATSAVAAGPPDHRTATDLRSAPARIVLFNVKYSPNLGDGLLSECLERELALSLPDSEIVSIDLAGRSNYSADHGSRRAIALSLLENCPRLLRRLATSLALWLMMALRLRRHYSNGLAGAEAVVVGGGNLFSDADLNFPMKVSAALAQAGRRKLPIAIYAVGVAREWSPAGRRIFARALRASKLTWTSVRDSFSRNAWQAHLAQHDVPLPRVVVDPGVLASRHYPQALRPRGAPRVGMCITDPMAVRYHASPLSAIDLDIWYPIAIRALVMQGFEVALFTNGSPEDRDYLQSHSRDWIRTAKGPVTAHRTFETPGDLASLVSSCHAVVGHRMHACIAAHSFGVPTIGLRWDVKLDSFFDVCGRSSHMLDPAVENASELGARVRAAMADPFDPAPLIERASAEVAAFAAHLKHHFRCTT